MFVPVMTEMVKVGGEVLMGTIDGIVTIFQSLFSADATQLLMIGPALFTIAAGLGAVAIASSTLAAVQIGQGILSFITGGPTDAAGGVFGLLASMIGSIKNLKVATPQAVSDLTSTVVGLGGFAGAYVSLLSQLGDMPSDSDIAPRLQNLAGAFAQTTQASGLQQSKTSNAVVPSQLQAVVDAILKNPAMDEMCAAADKTNALLAQILAVLANGQASAQASASPQRVQSGPTNPKVSGMTLDIASFGH
jgi:hypothetical protein